MKRTYAGSCHCGDVRYTVEADLAAGTVRCNCRICTKTRNWGARVARADFHLLTPDTALATYRYAPFVTFTFCKRCGTRCFSYADIPQLGGEIVNIQLSTLDDASPDELLEGPIQFCDGRNDAWWNTPAETRHL